MVEIQRDPNTSEPGDFQGHASVVPLDDLMLQEVHHRTANFLTLLMIFLRTEFAKLGREDAKIILADCERRILATSELHRFSCLGWHVEMSTQDHLQALCSLLTKAILAPLDIRCHVSLADGQLSSRKLQLLGLVIAELVTNAAKHGFCGRPGGDVHITVERRDHRWSCIVSDNGCGLGNSYRGLGSQLLDRLIEALGGEARVHSASSGTTKTIYFFDPPTL